MRGSGRLRSCSEIAEPGIGDAGDQREGEGQWNESPSVIPGAPAFSRERIVLCGADGIPTKAAFEANFEIREAFKPEEMDKAPANG